jgi:hypothetical protein
MANIYKNLPVLSKVKIGEQVYYLKDAELRALVDTFGDAVNYSVDKDTVTTDGNLATVKAMKAYIEAQVAGLTGAMHFVGVKEELPAEGANGDVVIVGTAEYVYSDGEWKLIGDEGVYATNAGVEAAYVKKTLTIAGIDHADNITAEELITALGLKALAFKDSATTTLTDYATGIEGAAYTPVGQVNVEVTNTSTAMASTGTFTPAGTIAGKTTAAGTVAIARDDANGVAVSGTVSAPTITVTPNTASVQHITSVGKLPTYTAAQYVAPTVNETKAQFAAEGIVATVGEGEDAEILVFAAANKVDALTGTGFNGGSYTAAEFNAGELPALGQAQTVVTGIASAEATAPTFTGDKFGATFTGTEANITADFTGTQGTVNVSGNYDKATAATGAFTGTEATIAPTLTKGTKAITVQ